MSICKRGIIRDGYSMPPDDYAILGEIQLNLVQRGVAANKSQILRTVLHALKALPVNEQARLVESLAPIKTGRPPGGRG